MITLGKEELTARHCQHKRHLGELKKKKKRKAPVQRSAGLKSCTCSVYPRCQKRLELHVHFSNVFVVSAVLGLSENKTDTSLDFKGTDN